MTANEVARETGWAMHGWGHGDRATNEAFAPLETYGERIDALLARSRALGFEAVDLWGAHLSPDWATDEHVAPRGTRSRVTDSPLRRTRPGSARNVRRSCELALALGTRIIGGGFSGEAAALAAVLREHGVTLAVENHPERTPAEVLAKIAAGGGSLAATVDTGWWATQGYDARAIEELGEHVAHVHLKDVLREGEPHETCAWKAVSSTSRPPCRRVAIDYAGALAVEHEPEDHDPSEEIRAMREQLEGGCMRIALVGAGNIAGRYAEAIAAAPELELVGATDLDGARAEASAEHGGRAHPDLAAVLADDAVETVVNLTVPQAHFEVKAAALAAGKHVHNEKPLALRHADAARLVELAREHGVRLSSASTLLGEAQQTLWKHVREGAVGRVRAVYAEANWGPDRALASGSAQPLRGGALLDVGVYPLTILTAMFGPVRKRPVRDDARGGAGAARRDAFSPGAPDFAIVAVLEHEQEVVNAPDRELLRRPVQAARDRGAR